MPQCRRLLLLLALPTLLGVDVAVAACPSGLRVARAQVTTEMEAREPANAPPFLTADDKQIVFFTEVLGGDGRALEHRWYHGEQLLARTRLGINGPRWRTWSRLAGDELSPGVLRLVALDEEGCVLSELEIELLGAPEPVVDDAQARALLEEAEARRRQDDLDGAEAAAAQGLELAAEPELQRALQDELRYHLPLARAREQLKRKDAAAMEVNLAGIREYLRDHPRAFEYRRVVDSYARALSLLQR